jgi:hypothetical protein
MEDLLFTLLSLAVVFGPTILLVIMGVNKKNQNNRDSAKVIFIFAFAWLMIAGGACVTMSLG